jgi:hypothetical protein
MAVTSKGLEFNASGKIRKFARGDQIGFEMSGEEGQWQGNHSFE